MNAASRSAALLCLLGLGACGGGRPTLRVWAFGREGEVVQALLPEFERRHPEIRVRVQQIPWTAAHEKLLTAFVGDATPDVAQLGNTWIPELVALDALEPLDTSIVAAQDYWPGIWDTNMLGGRLYGVPWYVDTRVIFYRSDIVAQPAFPATWAQWRDAMRRVRTTAGNRFAILLPLNEWAAPVVLGMANGAPLLRDGGRYGDFEEPRFRRAFAFYIALFREGLAPSVDNAQVANRYQAFGNGEFAMSMTGPWDIGEYERRLPASLDGKWATAPMPAPAAPGVGGSLAGGSSLVVFRRSRQQAAGRALIEFLSEPRQQVRFYALTGDLPARRSAWADSSLATNRYVAAFREQLKHVVSAPKVPEWEQIATAVARYAEEAARGTMSEDAALAALDRDVDRMLEKRRWLLAHGRIAVAK